MSKTTTKVLAGLFLVTCAAAVTVLVSQELKKRKKLKNISDEGYETAHDVLYPEKEIKSGRLHFGPVLPT